MFCSSSECVVITCRTAHGRACNLPRAHVQLVWPGPGPGPSAAMGSEGSRRALEAERRAVPARDKSWWCLECAPRVPTRTGGGRRVPAAAALVSPGALSASLAFRDAAVQPQQRHDSPTTPPAHVSRRCGRACSSVLLSLSSSSSCARCSRFFAMFVSRILICSSILHCHRIAHACHVGRSGQGLGVPVGGGLVRRAGAAQLHC